MSVSKEEESVTVFSTLPGQFPDVLESIIFKKIKTKEFLNACMGVVTIVEKFGKVFAPVIHDINGNIHKISGKYEEDKENHAYYLEDMILKQKNEGELLTVNALQWLRRELHFISLFFQYIIDDSDNGNNTQDLSPFIKSAYKESLERYHGWLGTQLFNILSRFTPNRQQLFFHLGLSKHNREEYVLHEMRIFNDRMSACVQELVEFYQDNDLETSDRV